MSGIMYHTRKQDLYRKCGMNFRCVTIFRSGYIILPLKYDNELFKHRHDEGHIGHTVTCSLYC
jgi:hypothetical protein